MKFSLLCPSRLRPKQLFELYNNIVDTVTEPTEVELLIKFDLDDIVPSWIINETVGKLCKFYCGLRSEYLQRDYYNWLAEKATGDYLWAIGDDVRFKTKGWDRFIPIRIEDYLLNKPDRIAYIYVDEEGSTALHPCFPLITKEAYKATGMYFHPELLSWGADRTLYELYEGIDRMYHIPNIEIKHLSYHDGKGIFDETAGSMKERFFRDPDCHNKVSRDIVPKQIEYLRGVINDSIV